MTISDDLLLAAEAVASFGIITQMATPFAPTPQDAAGGAPRPHADGVFKPSMGFLYNHWLATVQREARNVRNTLQRVTLHSRPSKAAMEHFGTMVGVILDRFDRVMDYHHPYHPTGNPLGMVITEHFFDPGLVRDVHRAVVMQMLTIHATHLQMMLFLTRIDHLDSPQADLLPPRFNEALKERMQLMFESMTNNPVPPASITPKPKPITREIPGAGVGRAVLEPLEGLQEADKNLGPLVDLNHLAMISRCIDVPPDEMCTLDYCMSRPVGSISRYIRWLVENSVRMDDRTDAQRDEILIQLQVQTFSVPGAGGIDPASPVSDLFNNARQWEHFLRRPVLADSWPCITNMWVDIAGNISDVVENINDLYNPDGSNDDVARRAALHNVEPIPQAPIRRVDMANRRDVARRLVENSAGVTARGFAYQSALLCRHTLLREDAITVDPTRQGDQPTVNKDLFEIMHVTDDAAAALSSAYASARLQVYRFLPVDYNDRKFLHKAASQTSVVTCDPLPQNHPVPGQYVMAGAAVRQRMQPVSLYKREMTMDQPGAKRLWLLAHCEASFMSSIHNLLGGLLICNLAATAQDKYPSSHVRFAVERILNPHPFINAISDPDVLKHIRARGFSRSDSDDDTHRRAVLRRDAANSTAIMDIFRNQFVNEYLAIDEPEATPAGTAQPMSAQMQRWARLIISKVQRPIDHLFTAPVHYDITNAPHRHFATKAHIPYYKPILQAEPDRTSISDLTRQSIRNWIPPAVRPIGGRENRVLTLNRRYDAMLAYILRGKPHFNGLRNGALLAQCVQDTAFVQHGLTALQHLLMISQADHHDDLLSGRNTVQFMALYAPAALASRFVSLCGIVQAPAARPRYPRPNELAPSSYRYGYASRIIAEDFFSDLLEPADTVAPGDPPADSAEFGKCDRIVFNIPVRRMPELRTAIMDLQEETQQCAASRRAPYKFPGLWVNDIDQVAIGGGSNWEAVDVDERVDGTLIVLPVVAPGAAGAGAAAAAINDPEAFQYALEHHLRGTLDPEDEVDIE